MTQTLFETVQEIASDLGFTAYEAAIRPARRGDVLILQVAKDRTPINLHEWVSGYWETPPAMSNSVDVIGDYDVIRIDNQTQQPIYREWGQAYVKSPVGAEFMTYSTEKAFVLSEHAQVGNSEERIITCLAEGIGVATGLIADRLPERGDLKRVLLQAHDLWRHATAAAPALLARYHDAPLLLGWPAPEWENTQARAFVRCAMAGGKKSDVHFMGLPRSMAVPAWTPEG
jgi:hypothetical protein